jgi:hypothetical protein
LKIKTCFLRLKKIEKGKINTNRDEKEEAETKGVEERLYDTGNQRNRRKAKS